jgi:hypothetical protein
MGTVTREGAAVNKARERFLATKGFAVALLDYLRLRYYLTTGLWPPDA